MKVVPAKEYEQKKNEIKIRQYIYTALINSFGNDHDAYKSIKRNKLFKPIIKLTNKILKETENSSLVNAEQMYVQELSKLINLAHQN